MTDTSAGIGATPKTPQFSLSTFFTGVMTGQVLMGAGVVGLVVLLIIGLPVGFLAGYFGHKLSPDLDDSIVHQKAAGIQRLSSGPFGRDHVPARPQYCVDPSDPISWP